jgi:hypothetical protein
LGGELVVSGGSGAFVVHCRRKGGRSFGEFADKYSDRSKIGTWEIRHQAQGHLCGCVEDRLETREMQASSVSPDFRMGVASEFLIRSERIKRIEGGRGGRRRGGSPVATRGVGIHGKLANAHIFVDDAQNK